MRDAENRRVADFVYPARLFSEIVSQCALICATWTPHYREPGHLISDVDQDFGSAADVEDPLLTAHRFAKFYLISSGDCVDSMTKLLSVDYPNLVGSAAIARAAAEHASRSLYLSDSAIKYQARMMRVHNLVSASLREYRSSNDAGATDLIKKWEQWRSRTTKKLAAVPRQKYGSAASLIERYFTDGAIGYEELSRPTHGNATWLAINVIQEQKQTAVARIEVMRNVMFAIRCVMAATDSLAKLWGVDLDLVAQTVGGRRSDLAITIDWDYVQTNVHDLSEMIASFDERYFVDARTEPQPRR